MADTDQSLAYTMPFQLTKKVHRCVYPYIAAENEANSQKGKIIVITGGGTGIGAAAARVWVRAGAEGVVIAGRRVKTLEKTAASLRQLGKTIVLAVPTDLTIASEVDELFGQIKNQFGRAADVVLANAGHLPDPNLVGDGCVNSWWKAHEINVKGLHHTVASFIKSQPSPSDPVGTIIQVNSGMGGLRIPGYSAYSTSKVAAHAYMEFVELEYPRLRVFTLIPGIVNTDMMTATYMPFAKDEAELTGSLALYLVQPKADYLRGGLTSVNWDVEDMEAHSKEILEKGLLRMSYVPILPLGGGKGL